MAATREIEEILAKLSASVTAARVKDPPDQQPVGTPMRNWSLPPSVTQVPIGARPFTPPRLGLEPPRFDGEDALDWIRYYTLLIHNNNNC